MVSTNRLAAMLAAGAVLWLVTGVLLALYFPNRPQSVEKWLLFFLIGPPLYFLGECAAYLLFSAKGGEVVSPRRFSILRVALGLGGALAFVALGAWFVEFMQA